MARRTTRRRSDEAPAAPSEGAPGQPVAGDGHRTRGYRVSKRSSRSGKQLRRQARSDRVTAEVGQRAGSAAKAASRTLRIVLEVILSVVIVAALLWAGMVGINALARWNARRLAQDTTAQTQVIQAKENIVVIGVKDDQAVGFVALKAERAGKRVLGFAIPDGAFVEVPGQGFESIGDSYRVGSRVSRDAVSNFLMVSFPHYVVVDSETFKQLATSQDVADLLGHPIATDLTNAERSTLSKFLSGVARKDVWIVPMPVKAVTVGDQHYFQPQQQEIADIVLQWWGVRIDRQKQPLRVIILNGVGTPGVAGQAAQQLISLGLSIIDSKNADTFDHKTTQVLLYHGSKADAERVRAALGVGSVIVESSAQDIADIIVIIGADYQPPPAD